MLADLGAGVILPFFGSATLALVVVPVVLAMGLLTFVSRWYGISVKEIRQRLDNWLLSRLLKREAAILGIDMHELLP